LRLFSFGGYGLALVVFGAYDSYPVKYILIHSPYIHKHNPQQGIVLRRVARKRSVESGDSATRGESCKVPKD